TTMSMAPQEYALTMGFDGNVFDTSNNHLNGVWNGNPSYAAGYTSESLNLSANKDSYVLVNKNTILGGMSELTLSVWAKKNTPAVGGTLINKHAQYSMTIGDKSVKCYLTNNVGTSVRVENFSVNSINNTNWHNYKMAYDGSKVYVFVDDIEIGSKDLTGMVANTNYNLFIGKYPWGTAFDGQIDELKILSTSDSGTVTVPAPIDPSNLQAVALSSNQINLTWQDNSDNETGFKLEISQNSNFSDITVVTIDPNTTVYIHSGLQAGTQYFYRIYAYNTIGNSLYSNTANAATMTSAPNDPSNLLAVAVSSNQINVTWQDNSDNEHGFKLERSTDASFTNPVLITLDENIMSYTDSALIPATLYFYRIYAYNASGNSEYSNEANALTESESNGGGQIIVDHTSIDMFNNIPEYYIDQVKKMLFNIPGESHGRAYIYGLEQLQIINPKYAVKASWSGAPEAYTTNHLRVLKSVRTPYWSNSSGEQHIWTSQTAINWINTHFSYCKNTLNNNIDVFGWGWCWDMTGTNLPGGVIDPVYKVRWAGRSFIGSTDNGRWGLDEEDTALTGNSINMNMYLNAMQNYINSNPDTAIVFTTGPADTTGENGYQNWLKHEYIRNYAKADSKRILFDYADILAHNPSEMISNTSWTDGDGIKHTYPIIYSGYRVEYNGGFGSGHISQEACVRLGKATWYMLARIAGWNGSGNKIQ
ncbi:MAG: fibronectin type III domain-containing protein, partial [Desulfobacterales bacterium]|nr:fibronectin type III domain-containing protein [Desulfobacterales bacterium]